MDRRGGVAVIIGLSTLPLICAVGVGMDLTRLASAKAKLQSAADAAALAGAIQYTNANQRDAAQASAKAAFASYAHSGDFSVNAASTTATASATSGAYQVTVTGSATVKTTIVSVAHSALLGMSDFGNETVTTSATAALPWNTPKFPPAGGTAIGTPSQTATGGNTTSTAWDWNAAYAYAVPMVNGVPDFTQFPPFSEFVEIASNCSSTVNSTWHSDAACNGKPGALPPVAQSFAPLPDQPIAFMFLNMNNGQWRVGGGGYGPNQYGLKPGEYAILLTAPLALGHPPSYLSDNSVAILNGLVGGGFNLPLRATPTTYSSGGSPALPNCALQIALVTDTAHPPTTPPVTPGVCYALNDARVGTQYANLSCNQLAGRTVMYFWNDMGAGRDDFDYMNLTYAMYCDKASTNPDSGGGSLTPSPKGAPAKLIQ